MIENISGLVVYPWVIVAIFGYAFNKKILVRKVWKMLFPIVIITDILTTILFHTSAAGQEVHGNPILYWVVFYVFYVSFLPFIYFQYVALYRYGFSKPEPWEEYVHNKD